MDILLDHAKRKFEDEERALQQTEEADRKKREIIQQVSCLMGRAQAFGYMSQFASMAELATLKEVKDQKLYREFGISTWAEFCEKFGFNYKTIDERLLTIDKFGLAFMETSQKIGLTRQDLRRIQALPSDTRVDAINATVSLENPTKEQVHDLLDRIEDQAVDNAMLKEKLSKTEAKITKKDAAIVKGQEQVCEVEDKLRKLQKEQELSIVRHDEQKSLEVLNLVKLNFHKELLRMRSIDLDNASPAIKAAVIALMEYLNRMLKQEFFTVYQAHPEIDANDVLDISGFNPGFKNPWDGDSIVTPNKERYVAADDDDDDAAEAEAEAKTATRGRR